MIKLKMKNYSLILTVKQQKISALSSGKIDKLEFLTGEEILPSYQSRIVEQAKFTYSPLGKPFEKQIKTIGDKSTKQVEGTFSKKDQR